MSKWIITVNGGAMTLIWRIVLASCCTVCVVTGHEVWGFLFAATLGLNLMEET